MSLFGKRLWKPKDDSYHIQIVNIIVIIMKDVMHSFYRTLANLVLALIFLELGLLPRRERGSWAKVFGPDRDSNPDLLTTVPVHYHCATETYN
uniref:Uncharacterized protein n=1 Tax=Acrobeloides nanus TaxID=290746 RepID=A0A914D5J2_9BILA